MPIKLADEHEALKLDVAATKLDGDDVFNKLTSEKRPRTRPRETANLKKFPTQLICEERKL